MTPNPRDPLDDLQVLLRTVEPSRGFAASVRAQLEMRPVRRRVAWPWWEGLAIGVTGLAALLLVVARTSQPSESPASVPTTLATRNPASAVARTPDRVATTAVRDRRVAMPVMVAPVIGQVEGHEVLVPSDQLLMVERLLDTEPAGHVRLPAPLVAAYDQDGLLVAPTPIVIAPLPALVPVDIDGPTGSPVPRTDRKDNP